MKKNVGKIIEVSELSVKVLLYDQNIKIKDVLQCDVDGQTYKFEIIEINSNIALAIPYSRVIGLKKGIDVDLEEGGIQIEYSFKILGKIYNPFGETIDEQPNESVRKRNIYDRNLSVEEI